MKNFLNSFWVNIVSSVAFGSIAVIATRYLGLSFLDAVGVGVLGIVIILSVREIFRGFLPSILQYILALTAILGVIIEYYNLWNGNREIVTWSAISITTVVVLSLIVIEAFLPIESQINTYGNKKIPVSRRYFKTARGGLIVAIFVLVIGGISLWQHANTMQEKVVIVVLPFVETENCHLTDQLLFQLDKVNTDYYADWVFPSSEAIGEVVDRKEKARRVGENNYADLVIWGECGIINNDMNITVNLESFDKSNYFPLKTSSGYQNTGNLAELGGFTLQSITANQFEVLGLFFSGVIHYETGDFQNALQFLNDAQNKGDWVNKLSNEAILFLYLGNAHMGLREFPNAYADYSRALSNCDSAKADCNLSAYIYTNRAFVDNMLEQSNQTIADATEAISLSSVPDRTLPDEVLALAYNERGWAKIALAQNDANLSVAYCRQAIADFTSAIANLKRYWLAYNNRGIANQCVGEYYLALADYTEAIDIAQEAGTYDNVGLLYAGFLSNYDKALPYFNKSIEIEPQVAAHYYNRGGLYDRWGNHRKAIDDYNTAISLDSNLFLAYDARGVSWTSLHNYSQAVSDFSSAIVLAPDAKFYYHRGLAYAQWGKPQNAISDFQEVLKNSNDVELLAKAKENLRYLGISP